MSELKTSAVKSIVSKGSFESSYGTLHKFVYEFEDGSVLSANHKTLESPFEKGNAVEYLVKGNKDGEDYGSVSKPQSGNTYNNLKKSSSSSPSNTASFALSYAKDLVVSGQLEIDDLISKANEFNKWLKDNS